MRKKLLGFAGALLALTAAMCLAPGSAICAIAQTYDLADGSVTVTASKGKQYVTQVNGVSDEPQTSDTVIGQTGSDTTSTTNTITVVSESGQTATVTLSGVNVDVSGEGKAAMSTSGAGGVTVTLLGRNSLKSGYQHAGLEKNSTGSLTITAKDTDQGLTAAGAGAAGIGGGAGYEYLKKTSCGDVTVSGSARLRVRAGTAWNHAGASIGTGAWYDDHNDYDGEETEPDICALGTDGRIEYYAAGAEMTEENLTKTVVGTGDHAWDAGTVTVEPTCTEPGERTYTCTRNAEHPKRTEAVPATGHDFTAETAEAAYLESAATCTERAVYYKSCSVCGESSEGTDDEVTFQDGELDPTNHEELTRVAAKEATTKAEGNTEYWYCKDCKRYFSDAAGTEEIKQVDTVIAKKGEPKKEEKKALPKTGDDATVQADLLLAGGFIVLGAAFIAKKRAA